MRIRSIVIAVAALACVVTAGWLGVTRLNAQLSSSERAKSVIAEFVGVDSSALTNVKVVSDTDFTAVRLEVSYSPTPVFGSGSSGSDAETGVFTVDTRDGYVTKAVWKARYAPTTGPASATLQQAQSTAEAFMQRHCPFWSEGPALARSEALPRDDPSSYVFTWQGQTGATLLLTSAIVSTATGEVWSYNCKRKTDLEAPTIDEAEATRIAAEYWTERETQSATVKLYTKTLTKAHLVRASKHSPTEGPVWMMMYLFEREGHAGWGDTLMIDALTGEIVRAPDL